ncbi:hypothetical protein [Pseudomonas delhiensis]|uniref:hypothetical protein n=1 Tax=Pseudomonas delhiensis TaxID=366289 RepID=UPI0011143397|nr:hypothetical protein [Pseudomonas delhiensis]
MRGIELNPKQVELMFGVAASELGIRGELARPTVKTRLKRSFVRFSLMFPNSCRMDEMIPALWIHLGGMDRICEIKEKIKPECLEVDLVLPIKGSEEQEGGFLSTSTLAELCLLGVTLSFQFV